MVFKTTDRRDRFARSWKLVGIPSKSKWKGSLLNNRILSRAMSRLMDRFQAQTLPVLEDTCFEMGKEDCIQLKDTLNIKNDDAQSCLEPMEMICLLNGIDSEIIMKNKKTASMKLKACPFSDVLVGVVPSMVVCRNYFRGTIQVVNKNATFIQPEKICDEDSECEFVVNV
ncbi:MAG: hypothetical protein KAR76_06660 [Methanosarcinales archaeon]|nr:hypothetical protein [Methanosarcinales archaeon]